MEKPRLGFWQIWNMSFGFLGIQFGWGLQMANMSAIYEYLGARADQIPMLWLAAPLTGLLVQPIIGHMSDRTWGRLGRRRPYFLVGALLSSAALVLMPNSPTLWMAAGLLWILDASINISMEPFRAFVADMLPEEQRTQGFAHAEPVHRPRRGGGLRAALADDQRLRGRRARPARARIPLEREAVLLRRRGGLPGRGGVDGRHHARVPARGRRGLPAAERAERAGSSAAAARDQERHPAHAARP